MKKISYIFFILIITILLAAGFLVVRKAQAPQVNSQEFLLNHPETVNVLPQPVVEVQEKTKIQTVHPIDNALTRITKKPFGIYVSPKNSPVSPEKFTGYHTAVDLEATSDEQNIEVAVKVLCDGKLLSSRNANGYGGVVVQECFLDGDAVTVIYGHIKLSSIEAKIGEQLKAGDFLVNLGDAYSSETDGERKHLHLGIHKGSGSNILGYVQSQADLSGWTDPSKYLE